MPGNSTIPHFTVHFTAPHNNATAYQKMFLLFCSIDGSKWSNTKKEIRGENTEETKDNNDNKNPTTVLCSTTCGL